MYVTRNDVDIQNIVWFALALVCGSSLYGGMLQVELRLRHTTYMQ